MPGQIELDRIFRRHDVDSGDFRQRRVERVRLSRTGRTGDEHHSPWLENGLFEANQRLGLEAELGHVQLQVVLVEKAHDDLLAEEGR